MEKLFDDTLLIQKERPTKITSQQEEQLYIDLAEYCIKHEFSSDDQETIIEDLKQLSLRDTGFEKAKSLENDGNATYEFDGEFIDWLDSISIKFSDILTANVKLWVKAHNPQPKLLKGTELKIIDSINQSKSMRKDCVVYITGINMERAYYTLNPDINAYGGSVVDFEIVEAKCEVI